MKKTILSFIVLMLSFAASAQSEKFEQRYNLLVSKLGPAGVGVETVLNGWEAVDSTDAKMLLGRFSYLFTKSQRTEVVSKPSEKYLGMEPLISLKDSTGNDIHYYQETFYDDELYGKAIQAVDKAIGFHPSALDFRFVKANAYIAYEKESPDMAIAYLMSLVEENASGQKNWTFEGEKMEKGFFQESMLEYCFSFYSIGSPAAMEAFLSLSRRMSELYPDDPAFLNNIGTYYLIAKEDYKTALKYYNKVLKGHPDDYTAIKNCVLLSRKQKNMKLEKKYLQMLAKYGPENEKLVAKARLDQMARK